MPFNPLTGESYGYALASFPEYSQVNKSALVSVCCDPSLYQDCRVHAESARQEVTLFLVHTLLLAPLQALLVIEALDKAAPNAIVQPDSVLQAYME